ncbi:MAG: hypothetical protein H6822_32485 [Planctomycetaceae bacterium]|nr:hypothetical protein [Planctomycetales bacterium]MCB9926904.1 hypothetical protein [Planctomycetaceae bacterium]
MMFGRPIRFLVLLGAAAGIPYAWFNEDFAPAVKGKVQQWATSLKKKEWSFGGDQTPELGKTFLRRDKLPGVSFETPGNDAALTGGVGELGQIMQSDVTPAWIMQRWSRVSTIHTEPGLSGFRVALVTGTELSDLAGSLTFYFDNLQKLRRITFDGLTGDACELVQVAAQRFNLRSEPALGAGLYLSRWNGQPTGVLRISHAPVIRAQRPHERLEVMLELNQPGVGQQLSARAQETLNNDRLTKRW